MRKPWWWYLEKRQMTTVPCYVCREPVRIVNEPPYVGVCEECSGDTRRGLMMTAENRRTEGQRAGMSKTRS